MALIFLLLRVYSGFIVFTGLASSYVARRETMSKCGRVAITTGTFAVPDIKPDTVPKRSKHDMLQEPRFFAPLLSSVRQRL